MCYILRDAKAPERTRGQSNSGKCPWRNGGRSKGQGQRQAQEWDSSRHGNSLEGSEDVGHWHETNGCQNEEVDWSNPVARSDTKKTVRFEKMPNRREVLTSARNKDKSEKGLRSLETASEEIIADEGSCSWLRFFEIGRQRKL